MQLQFFRGTLPKHVLDGRDIDQANDYNRSPLGTGPVSRRRVEDGRIRAARDACRTTGAAPTTRQIDRLLFRFLANTTTRINQLKAGEVHVVALVPWDKVPRAARDVSRRSRSTGARQRLRARHAQRAALPAVPGCPRPAGACPRDRSRADRAHDPRQPRARRQWRRSSRCRWAYTDNVRKYDYDPAASHALCSTKPAGRDADATACASGTGSRSRSR